MAPFKNNLSTLPQYSYIRLQAIDFSVLIEEVNFKT